MSFSQDSTHNSTEENLIHSPSQIDVIKLKLKSRIFLGRYVERRLVNELIGYKDIVLVSDAEVELNKDLLDAKNKLKFSNPSQWVGITSGENYGHKKTMCLWTEIDNQPLGPFWFQIKSLKSRNNEIFLSLKCLRYISDEYLEIEPMLTKRVKKINENLNENKLDTISIETIKNNFKETLSVSNCAEFFKFVFAFIIAVFTGSTTFVAYIGNFVLALIAETSNLMKNSTPMFLGILDLVGKIVGGFYILMAMIFKPHNSYPSRNSNRQVTHVTSEQHMNQPYNMTLEKYDHRNID